MKTAKRVLKIGLLGVVGLIVWGMYADRLRKQEMLCEIAYLDFDSEIKAALSAEGFDKLAHLQAAEMVIHILHHKDCCRFEKTCPAGLQL